MWLLNGKPIKVFGSNQQSIVLRCILCGACQLDARVERRGQTRSDAKWEAFLLIRNSYSQHIMAEVDEAEREDMECHPNSRTKGV
jgi:hypothetical protein